MDFSMKKILLFVVAMSAILFSGCGAFKSQAYYDYKSKLIGTELDGTYTIRSWGRARNAVDAYVQARKQAVKDVIFTGVQAETSNLTSLKPLLFDMNAEEKYEDYFAVFFADGGEFEQYVSMKERRVMSSNFSRTEAQTLAQVTVCVNRVALKEKLIKDGILKAK